MKTTQLSLFLENEPGHLARICRALADAGVNIVTLSLADTSQFGILRLIVDDWRKAKEALERERFIVKTIEVIATQVEDRPGGLADILGILRGADIDIEYMYAFTFRCDDKATLVFRFDKPEAAVAALRAHGAIVLTEGELLRRARGD